MSKKALNQIFADPVARASLEARFWSKVDVRGPDECWLWTAKAKHPHGYGRMSAADGVNLKAHQIAYALRHGSVPVDRMICHSCDNPPCCNPAHFFVGSQTDNMRDAADKGRISPPPHSFGEHHHATKFDANVALRIKRDRRAAHIIAAEVGVSAMTVYRLRRGTTWKKLQEASV